MNIKNLILGIGIAIIFLMFGIYGTKVFMVEPKYEDFCKGDFYRPVVKELLREGEKCPAIVLPTSDEEKACADKKGYVEYNYDSNNCPTKWECNTCQAEYDKVDEIYLKAVFIFSVILGLIVTVVGGLLLKFEPVGSGLMGGGILLIISGCMRYWMYMEDVTRFVILGISLAALIYLGYLINKRVAKKESKKKK